MFMARPRLLIALCAITALLAVALFALKLNPQTRPPTAISIREGDPGDIRLVDIQNEHGLFEIRYTGEGYEVHDIPAPLVDYARFLQLMGDCAAPMAVQTVAARTDNPGLYGLGEPAATVYVRYASGPDLEFYLGNTEPVSKNVYFAVKGKSPIYLMDGGLAANFLCEAKDYIDLLVTEGTDYSSPLSAVVDATFEWPGEERYIAIESALQGGEEIRRKALSYGAVSHLVNVGGDTFELDQTYGVDIFGSLLGIKAVGVEAYNCNEAQLAGLGFRTPSLIVEFGYISDVDGDGNLRNMRSLTLSIVRGDRNLILRGDEDIVYIVDTLPFMDIDEGRLMTRWYLSPLIMDLSGVKVVAGGLTLDFALTGEANADESVTLNGYDFDMAVFRKLFRLLTSASHDGERLDGVGDDINGGEPLVKITYEYMDEFKPPDIIEFYRASIRKLLVVINGKTISFGMRDMYATRVSEACAAISAGLDFDETW